jgi:hypothetical protein
MLAIKSRCAQISGTMLVPGVSKNGRLYTAEMIRATVALMQERLTDGDGSPLTMLTHHAAGDDSLEICGRLTAVDYQPDGSATFEADIADNDAGRGIAALVTPDKPFLSNVSIRGWWIGTVREVNHDGVKVTTADAFEIDGLDFTKSPGVTGARITSARLTEATHRATLTEALEGVLVTETVTPVYADHGYKGRKAFPISTPADVRSSWALLSAPATTEAYTAQQLKRIRGRVREAAKKLNVNVIAESTAVTAAVTEALEEAYASMNVDNGPADIRVSGWISDPSDIPAVGRRIAAAVLAALAMLDPDNDGDIDLDDVGSDDDDPRLCAACGSLMPENALYCPGCAAPVASPTGESTTPKEPAMSEKTETEKAADAAAAKATQENNTDGKVVTEAAPAAELSEAVITAIGTTVAAAVAAALTPAATETVPAVETADLQAVIDEAVNRAVATATAEMRAEVQKIGGPVRKGVHAPSATEAAETAKPLHEMSDEEFEAHKVATWRSVGLISG